MKSVSIRLSGQRQRDHAKSLLESAPDGYVCKIAAETRRDRQNALLWSYIADIQKQVPEMASFSPDDVKNRFMHALGIEMRFLPCLEGEGMFPVGLRSSTLTVAQFSGLVELINEWAARHGVKWSHNPYEQ